MATRQNTDFLTFNAYSIKDLITRKLSEDKSVTDQIYEGSNLAILIDIFSYMAQTMLYNLNTAAAESMFSDTQFYENMNRLVQFLGYMPHGMQPATALMKLEGDFSQISKIPSYCYVDTGKVDKNGKKIYYSIDKTSFLKSTDDIIEKFLDVQAREHMYFYNGISPSTKSVTMNFYNGVWRTYSNVFTAAGTPFETFVLTGLKSDTDTNDFIGHGFIDVFVESEDGTVEPFIPNDGPIFKAQRMTDHIFGTNDPVFSLRLNEDKTYVISFGDGYNGKKLKPGDRIHVIYMESNGSDTELDIGEITNAVLKFPTEVLRNFKLTGSHGFCKKIFGQEDEKFMTSVQELNAGKIKVTNISVATEPKDEETVDEIRQNAPAWFRMGNRLVTKGDYEYYLKSRHFKKSRLVDVKCMNNWEYMSTFYKWLYELGSNKEINNPRYFLRPEKLVKYYKYTDPADSNNIYLWTAIPSDATSTNTSLVLDFATDSSVIETYKHSLILVKDLTHEPIFVPPIIVKYKICANDNIFGPERYGDSVENQIRNNNGEQSENIENYVEVTLNDNVVYANNTIIKMVGNTIVSAFDPLKNRLGEGVNIENLLNEIYKIEGISRIRTICHDKLTDRYVIRNGLSFASWSNLEQVNGQDFVGIDLEVGNTTRGLLPFQFPYLVDQNSTNFDIRVIRHSVSYLNEVIY